MEEPETDTLTSPPSTVWRVDGRVRTAWRLAGYVMFLVIALVAWLAVEAFQPFALPGRFEGQTVLFLAVFTATALSCIYIDGIPIGRIGLGWTRGWWRQLAIGMLTGAGLIVLQWGVLALAGQIVVTIPPGASGGAASVVGLGAGVFLLVAFTEEMLMRGYPFLALMEGTKGWIALLATSVVFAAMHIGNPGVTAYGLVNILLAGIWLGYARLVSGSLWLPIGLHFGWNFALGTLVGLPVSGITEQGLLASTPVGCELLTGGAFGLEGGAAASLALGVGILVLRYGNRVESGERRMESGGTV